MSEILAALSARVSSEQQAEEHTIDSRVVALRTRVTEDGLSLAAEHEVPGRRLQWRDVGSSSA